MGHALQVQVMQGQEACQGVRQEQKLNVGLCLECNARISRESRKRKRELREKQRQRQRHRRQLRPRPAQPRRHASLPGRLLLRQQSQQQRQRRQQGPRPSQGLQRRLRVLLHQQRHCRPRLYACRAADAWLWGLTALMASKCCSWVALGT